MEKTFITFEKESDTSIKVLYKGKHVGNIWSEGMDGHHPYPHNDEIPTLESIQICGFANSSEIWACGVFHGTKDVVVRFNPMMDEYYKEYHKEYKDYVEECFKQNKPQMIKPFNDWVAHMGYPDKYEIQRKCSEEKKDE